MDKKITSTAIRFFAAVSVLVLLGGCAVVQSLREDIDEESDKKRYAADFDYTSPENRSLPPPPATVDDERVSTIAGTPVDLSGMRAKSGRVTKKDFTAENLKNDHSLWSEDGQHNYLFARNKNRSAGDLVTIRIEDDIRRDMILEVKKLLPPEYRDREIYVPGVSKEKPDESATRKIASATKDSEGKGDENFKENEEDVGSSELITAEVIERYPNGNLRVRGMKRIPFKTKTRSMEVTAIVRNSDVNEKDIVKSSKILEHRLELYK